MGKYDTSEIIDFLKNKMGKVQRDRFEEKLRRSPELKSVVEDYQILLSDLDSLLILEHRQQFEEWNQLPDPVATDEDLIDQELITLYHRGELEGPLKADFDQRIQSEPAFRQKLEAYLEIFQGFEAIQIQSKRSEFMELAETASKSNAAEPAPETGARTDATVLPVNVKRIKRRRLIPLGLAAVLTAALVFTVYNWWNRTEAGDQLAVFLSEQYEKPFKSPEKSSSVTNAGTGTYTKGMEYYDQDQWDLALPQFEAVPEGDSMYLRSLYYAAHCYHLQKKYRLAANRFSDALRLLADRSGPEPGINKYELEWNVLLSLLGIYNSTRLPADAAVLERELNAFINSLPPKSSYRKEAVQLRKLLNGIAG